MKPSERAINYIVQDLMNRSGLGNEWDMIDHDTQEGIKKVWAHIIEEEYTNTEKNND